MGWSDLLAQLATEGLERLVLLGGARLAASLLALDLVDGLQLTLVPRLLGGEHSWLPQTPLPAAATWELQESSPLGEEGELLLRYRSPTAPRLTPDPCETAY
jgi:5-amino-6-(5-phosphoribosylamino)uracil reductase